MIMRCSTPGLEFANITYTMVLDTLHDLVDGPSMHKATMQRMSGSDLGVCYLSR